MFFAAFPESNSKQGCPPVDPGIRCIRFNKKCEQNSDCKELNSICCSNNCGTFFHNPNDGTV